ncbi:hypothetical protein [Delftia lacustris]
MSIDIVTHTAVKALEREVKALELDVKNLEQVQRTAGKPLRTTRYTSGAGIHTMLAQSTYQLIWLQGPGGNGGMGAMGTYGIGGGGGSAGMCIAGARITFSGDIDYQVGAAGGGNSTTFGPLRALGGLNGGSGSAGYWDRNPTAGGGAMNGWQKDQFQFPQAIGGGSGGTAGYQGCAPGFPTINVPYYGIGTGVGAVAGGGGGGGSSMFGVGGAGGKHYTAGGDGTGYGAGGGGGGGYGDRNAPGGLGTGGLIIVEEY